jgi:hypothetical protein
VVWVLMTRDPGFLVGGAVSGLVTVLVHCFAGG